MQDEGSGAPPVRPPHIIALGPELLIRGVVIPSFAQFATTGEDNLRIQTCGAVSGVNVSVQGRFLDALTGKIIPFDYTVAVTSSRLVNTNDFPLGTGYLLNISAVVSGFVFTGQVFVIVSIIRGLGGATFLLGTLIASYITSFQPIGWPGTPINNSVETGGYYRSIVGTKPPAGVDITETCPTGARWELIAIELKLTTSAVAAARNPKLQLFVSGTLWYQAYGALLFNANSNAILLASQLALRDNTGVIAGIQYEALPLTPGNRLLAGDIFQTATDALDAGDQWQSPQYLVREWLEVR